MEKLIEAIRLATMPDATDEARAAGVHACRSILAALHAHSGKSPTPATPTPLQTAVTALSNVPAEQLLDLAITKLRSLLPEGTTIEPVLPLRLPLLPVQNARGRS